MLAFFAPVSSSKSSPYMSTSAARTNIIENAKPYTKTVTLASETNISLAESNATERICHIQRSNNDTATSFARKAQQFGSYSSSKTDMPLSLDVKGNNHNGNINYKATASNGVTHEPSVFSVPKRSLFSSVLKRFSIQRSKTPESARRVETGAVTIDQKKHIFDEHSKPRRFRRWLTQRIRKRKSKG
ncbi:unnamed protein product [Dicrocoelium dendriticum]|nr:unnamed protein product [Dicrocoelium dendriticum]